MKGILWRNKEGKWVGHVKVPPFGQTVRTNYALTSRYYTTINTYNTSTNIYVSVSKCPYNATASQLPETVHHGVNESESRIKMKV